MGAETGVGAPSRGGRKVRHATTPSGSGDEDSEIGEGKTANAGDYVSVIYETRLNGKVIDATGGGDAGGPGAVKPACAKNAGAWHRPAMPPSRRRPGPAVRETPERARRSDS